MNYTIGAQGNKTVGRWLMLGVFMILVQVVLGGITRLTESGLSITEWDVVMGTLPPLSVDAWQEAFNAYKATPQYETLNKGMSLAAFKKIFFWEYIHRLWARLLGFVFLVPLIFFIARNQIKRIDYSKYIMVFLLGGLQGAVGWIMVKSGLEDRIFVDPVKLMLHLVLAAVLLLAVYRLALENLSPPAVRLYDRRIRRLLGILVVLTLVQISFGGLVAGSRAALAYATWPKMGEAWIPASIVELRPVWKNFLENPAMLQFLHRMFAYFLVIFTLVVVYRSAGQSAPDKFHRARFTAAGLILAQLVLGIITVMQSKISIPVSWGVIHQLTALLFLLTTYYMHYSYKYN